MFKIAFVIPSLIQQGPVIVVHDLVRGLMREGHYCKVYFFDDSASEVALSFPCDVEKIKFKRRIMFCEYDIVHSHCLRGDAYVFFHKPLHTKTRFVSTIHNFVMKDLATQYNRWVALLFGNLWMFMLTRHDMRVVLSKTAMAYYKRWFGHRRLTYVYNSRYIDASEILSESELLELEEFKGNSILLGINALLTPIKGVDMIIKALPLLPNCNLFVVGDGKSIKDLQRLAIKYKVYNRVYFAGRRPKAYRYLPYYDIYVMPSRSEGFPLALLEAIALKKNIVCSDIPIFQEILNPDEVHFFRLEDIESLVEAVKDAVKNDTSEMAYAHYLKDYTLEHFTKSYLQIYRNLLA